mgnify:FL=1
MPTLFEDFRFSQTNLQDFVECPRRFQLRYVEGQPWPVVQSQPVLERERHVELGARFHRLVERHQLGLDPDLLQGAIDDSQLLAWWLAYMEFDYLHTMEGVRYPEFLVSVDLEGHRLVAAYDLLVVRPDGGVVIFDWKTYRRRPVEGWFSLRVQSRLYPLVLVLAGRRGVLGFPVDPEEVELVYWLVGAPREPVVLPYSLARFESDLEYVLSVLGSVGRSFEVGDWSRTSDLSLCGFCEYRSLCERDVPVSDFDEFAVGEVGDSWALLGDVFEVGF